MFGMIPKHLLLQQCFVISLGSGLKAAFLKNIVTGTLIMQASSFLIENFSKHLQLHQSNPADSTPIILATGLIFKVVR